MKNKKLIYILIAISITLFVINSCKKEELNNKNTIAEIRFNPDKNYGTVTDNEGNEYKTIVINDQTWMAENLKATKYQNGDDIETTPHPMMNPSHTSIPKYQWPAGNDTSLVPIYGRIYTWYAATDERSICPEGWHLPTLDEWKTLVASIGGWDEGGKLKETGNRHWKESNKYVTNETGFTALPASYNGGYPGGQGSWWLDSDDSLGVGYCYYLNGSDNWAVDSYDYKQSAFSVRCLKSLLKTGTK